MKNMISTNSLQLPYIEFAHLNLVLLLLQLTLEFYERRKGRWIIFADNSSWEMWKLKVNVVRIKTDAGEKSDL